MPAGAQTTPAQLVEVLRVYGITRSRFQTASITGVAYETVCEAVEASERAAAATKATPAPPAAYTYRWRSREVHPERWGKPCRIVHDSKVMRWGPGSRVLVEFDDGLQVETLRFAIKKARGLSVAAGSGMATDNRAAPPARARRGG